jgi:hypothetical protein
MATEHTINDALAAVLRETRRAWSPSRVVNSEKTEMLKGGNRRPDINAFSKKMENHAYQVALHFMYHDFARVHTTLGVTPAMEAGVSDHVWSLEGISDLAK